MLCFEPVRFERHHSNKERLSIAVFINSYKKPPYFTINTLAIKLE